MSYAYNPIVRTFCQFRASLQSELEVARHEVREIEGQIAERPPLPFPLGMATDLEPERFDQFAVGTIVCPIKRHVNVDRKEWRLQKFQLLPRHGILRDGQGIDLAPHEAARLQYLPDFWDFTAAARRGELAVLIGNAAPPVLATAVLEPALRQVFPVVKTFPTRERRQRPAVSLNDVPVGGAGPGAYSLYIRSSMGNPIALASISSTSSPRFRSWATR